MRKQRLEPRLAADGHDAGGPRGVMAQVLERGGSDEQHRRLLAVADARHQGALEPDAEEQCLGLAGARVDCVAAEVAEGEEGVCTYLWGGGIRDTSREPRDNATLPERGAKHSAVLTKGLANDRREALGGGGARARVARIEQRDVLGDRNLLVL